jgi:DeoR/GlpR family transcriptional regulator of sugar metabolism
LTAVDGAGRRRQIVEALSEREEVQVAALAAALRCSEMTVRRDLEALERDGVLRRVHGGATRARQTAEETPYAMRAFGHTDEKARIGARCAELLDEGETVVLDGGTTAMEVARLLRGRRLTVMPLALRPVFELHDSPQVRLLLPGGEVRPGELSLIGGLSRRSFSELHFDTFVLSPCGIDPESGVTAHLMAEAEVKRAALDASRRVIAVADSSKLGVVAFDQVCPIQKINVLVTDRGANPGLLEQIAGTGVDVQLV